MLKVSRTTEEQGSKLLHRYSADREQVPTVVQNNDIVNKMRN